MSWKDRAIKVEDAAPPSKSPKLSDWKSRAKKVEDKRAENVVVGEEIRQDIGSRIEKGFGEMIEDVPVAIAQGVTLGFADELAGSLAAAYQKSTGDERPISDLYEETRDIIRNKTNAARERSPISTFIAEVAPSVMVGGGGLARTAIESAAYGAGASEADDLQGIAFDSAAAGALGAGVSAAGKLIKKPFTDPKDIKARFAGQDSKAFQKIGKLGDPEEMVSELDAANFFKYKKADLDLDTGKFIPVDKKSKGLPSRREALSNANLAMKKIRSEVNSLIDRGAKKERYYGKDLANYQPLIDDMDDIVSRATDKQKAEKMVEKELKNLQYSIDNPQFYDDMEGVTVSEPQGVSLSLINDEKINYQAASSAGYKSLNPSDKEDAKIKEAIARNLRQFVQENAGEYSERVGRLNRMSHQLHNAESGLSPTVAQKRARGENSIQVNPYASAFFNVKSLAEGAGGGEKGMLMRAGFGQAAEGIPVGIRRPVESAIKAAPSRLMNREPQSVNLPEQLIKTPLPRNTERILENKDFVLAKAAQQTPEIFQAVQDVLNDHQEKLPELLPMLIKMAPQMFSYDKYNRVDDVIMDPQIKELARKDTMNREDLSKLDKAQIINDLNKTGKFYDY